MISNSNSNIGRRFDDAASSSRFDFSGSTGSYASAESFLTCEESLHLAPSDVDPLVVIKRITIQLLPSDIYACFYITVFRDWVNISLPPIEVASATTFVSSLCGGSDSGTFDGLW